MSALDEFYEAVEKAKVRIGHQGGARNSPTARRLWAKQNMRESRPRRDAWKTQHYRFNDNDSRVKVEIGRHGDKNAVLWTHRPNIKGYLKRAMGLKPKKPDFRRTTNKVMAAVERHANRTGGRTYGFNGLTPKHDRIYARVGRKAPAGWRAGKTVNFGASEHRTIVRKTCAALYAEIAKAQSLFHA